MLDMTEMLYEGRLNNKEITDVQNRILKLFESNRNPKFHIQYLNKLSKDPRRLQKNMKNDLRPVIQAIVNKYMRDEQLRRLNTE